MTRMAISENEEYPVYDLKPVEQHLLDEHPDAWVEVDQALIDEYAAAERTWRSMQAKLGALARADWQERYGPK